MKKILIIGAGFLQDFVIQKAKQLGYYTIAIDGNPEAIGFMHADKSAIIDIINPKACCEFAKKEKVNGVLTAATDYGVLTASYIAETLGLPGLSYEAAKRIKNKYEVHRGLFEADVDDLGEVFEVTADTDLAILQLHYPVMVKPCDGSGSRAAKRVNSDEKLQEACLAAIAASVTKKAIIEPFITGKEYGAESLVVNGEIHVLGIMKKWMTKPPYYAELGHQIPSGLPMTLENEVIDYVRKAIKALGINYGAVNMDLLITNTGKVHIVDVGARMGGNMIGPCIIPIGTGIHYIENLVHAVMGDPLDWSTERPQEVASKLLAFHAGRICKLPDFDRLEKEYNVEIYHHMKIGDRVNEYHTNLDGCGYIIARGEAASKTAERVLLEISKYVV